MKRRLIILVLSLSILVAPVLIFNSGLYAWSPSLLGTPRFCDAPPCCVTFTNLMTGGVLPYSDAVWDFGDGNIQMGAVNYGDTITHCYTEYGSYDIGMTIWDADGGAAFQVEREYIQVGEEKIPTHALIFCQPGFFPKHLPDSYTGSVQLRYLADVPSEVQGVYWYDCNAMEWKFWAPGAPGCTLDTLVSGLYADYMVAVTGGCDWEIPLLP